MYNYKNNNIFFIIPHNGLLIIFVGVILLFKQTLKYRYFVLFYVGLLYFISYECMGTFKYYNVIL